MTNPILEVSPLSLSFAAFQGVNPPPQNVNISNGNGGTLHWSIASDSPWISAQREGLGNATAVPVNINTTGLGVGTYTGRLTVGGWIGTLNSPQIVTVTLAVVSPCELAGTVGAYVDDLSLSIVPATALYESLVPTSALSVNESYDQGRKAIIIDFNDSDGLYARDLGVIFTWPVGAGTILDLWQPSIIPEQDDLYNRLSYHFLVNALGLVGWGHIRQLNIAHNATQPITLLLTFDQWPDITLTIPSSSGGATKTKVVLPPNKFKMVEGWLSSSQPFMLWAESCELTLGQWGRADGYRVLKPFSG
jgi:hypothetical protein